MLLLPQSAWALQTIDSIDIKVELLDDGSIDVTQVWDAYSDEGSEFYINFQRLGPMQITDYTVEDETGRQFEYKPNWNINDSFEAKAYKYGENQGPDGYELNFGKSVRGDKTYIIRYTLTNAVQAFPDMDGFNLRFVNDDMDPAPNDIRIEIFKEGTNLTQSNARVWGFGFDGETEFTGGRIVAENDKKFTSRNHATIVIGLEKGIIQPTYQGSGTFEQLKDRALRDSSFSGESSPWSWLLPVIIIFVVLIFIVAALIAGITGAGDTNARRFPKNRKQVKIYKDDYNNEIPAEANLPLTFYFYNMRKRTASVEDNVMAAYFLKWVHDGALNLIYNPGDLKGLRGFISQFKTHDFFEIVKEPNFDSQFEVELWEFMTFAAGDHILDNKELSRYVSKRTSEFSEMFSDMFDEAADMALAKDLLEVEERRFLNKYYLTTSGLQEMVHVHGFKNFLNDYTLIRERYAQEVHLWDQYLILATLFGIGDKVAEQFQKIMPDYHFAGSTMTHYDTMVLMNNVTNLSNSVYSSYNSASSGGGGSTSLGGGGGFSGGGSGGGGR